MIPLSEPVIGEAEAEWVGKCLNSGYISSVGPMVSEFERRFAERVGSKWAVATASGTAAIHVALHAVGIRSGDAVVVPDLTFIASMNPVLYCDAKPVLVDVDPKTWCLDLALLRELCQRSQGRSRIKAVIPVHLYGCACDMTELRALAEEFDFIVVEDATEALGTSLQGRQVGTFGQVGCFSFNGNKLLTTGAGGMVVTDSDELATRIRYLVNQARDNSDAYIHSQMGFNYRMDSLSAALGIAQLGRCDTFLARKHAIAKAYNEVFAGVPGVQVPPVGAGVDHCYWLYSVVLADPVKRDAWIQALNAAGIAARPFFHPLHAQPYMNTQFWIKTARGMGRSRRGSSDELSRGGINLPSSSGMPDTDLATVVGALQKLIAG